MTMITKERKMLKNLLGKYCWADNGCTGNGSDNDIWNWHTKSQLRLIEKMEEIVYSCLYEEWVEVANPENFEAGKVNVSKFNKSLLSLKQQLEGVKE